mmetsp:Transcript_48131/g.76598  ORF Transcript_48131/g.76598 Transcript_48131/m.76598 type:complete len:84 (-) Transcript_48131:3156-3407(-)
MEHQDEREQQEPLEKMDTMVQRETREQLVIGASRDDKEPRDLLANQAWQDEMGKMVPRVIQELMGNPELLALREHLVNQDLVD